MSQIYNRFIELVSSRKHHRARGWINIDCPACGDKRQRGGFLSTESGGFRYFCYNGGCEFHDAPTGWEPGNGLAGRVKHLFHLLGGSLRDLDFRDLIKQNRNIYDKSGNVIGQSKKLETTNKFPDYELPVGCQILEDIDEDNKTAMKVKKYLYNRGECYKNSHLFLWTPEKPNFLIIPYLHFNEQVVGYLGRDITKTKGKERFEQRAPTDYMFNQHLLYERSERYVIVTESPMDAIPVYGVAVRGSKFTQKQINLLKVSGREPILVPDQQRGEYQGFLDAAEENEWLISVPDWDNRDKDLGDSYKKNGLLYSIEMVVSNATKNYKTAQMQLNFKGL